MQATSNSITTSSCVTPADVARRRLALFVLMSSWVLTWALAHGYDGIKHDGTLYTLQALGHLHPQTLSRDVFLEFGSQDHYTVFSPIYAALMAWLGTEPAAALLTLISQLALVASALLLARRTLPSPILALLAITVLVAIPGTYGADRVFHYLETIVTPRMMAEALVLCGLAAALSARGLPALLLMALAALLHPVMAAPGFAALAILHVGIPQPRRAAIAGGVALVALVIAAYVFPFGPFSRFDADWLELVRRRSPNLFLALWKFADWDPVIVVVATLTVGLGTLPGGRARTLCLLSLATGLAGLMLNLITVDGLELVHFTQLQPWRWMWLATVSAALLLPAITLSGWQAGWSGRATVLLIVAAWVFDTDPLALDIALSALVCMTTARFLPQSPARLLFFGTCGVLVVAVVARLAWNSVFLEAYYYDPEWPPWLRQAASFTHDGTVPVATALLALWLSSRRWLAPGLIALAVLTTAAGIALFPDTWSRWTNHRFPPSLVAQFRPWQALIPPGDAVFWPEAPLEASLLLDRPDYLSTAQTTGLVFSRPAAMEMRRRAFALVTVTNPAAFLQFSGAGIGIGPSPDQLQRACRTGEFSFLVTGAHLGWRPAAEVPASAWHSSGGLRLYRCSDRAS